MVDGPRLGDQLCFALYAASGAVVRAYRPLLARIGLTYPQYLVMMVLWESEDVPVAELARRLEQSPGGLAPDLRRLVEAGLAERRVEGTGRPVVRMALTDEGRRLAPLAGEVQTDVACQTGLDPDDYADLRDRLHALIRRTSQGAAVDALDATETFWGEAADDLDLLAAEAALPVLHAPGVAAYVIAADGTIAAASPTAAQILHWAPDDLVGRPAHATLHHSDERGVPAPAESCPIQVGPTAGRVARAERDVFWRRDGKPVTVWWAATPIVDPATAERRTMVVFDRVDAGGAGEQAYSDADARLIVLGQLSELLGITDVEVGLRRIAALGASTLADWCVIDRVDGDRITRAAIADRVRPQAELDRRLTVMPPLTPASAGSLGRVLRGQDAVAIDLFADDAAVPGSSQDPLDVAQAGLFADLGAAHAVVLPLRARDHLLGAMTWVRKDPARPFTDADVLLATVFGFRVGLWLDNARLYGEQKRMSETLQRSLLPAVPELDDLRVVARYVPASEGVEVGGDWYDAHLTHDGHLAVTIGDVSGHDSEAAARMSQLRNMLRFAVLDRPRHPEDAMARVDTAMQVLSIPGHATALVAVVHRGAADRRSIPITWANAGHLPPLVVDADGTCRFLDTGPDLPLGVGDGTARRSHQVQVEPGATMVLYTDGLVERRREGLDVGLDRLLAVARQAAALPLDDFCDALLAGLTPAAQRSDDIALVAIRFDADHGAEQGA